jgi:hypothetical protein
MLRIVSNCLFGHSARILDESQYGNWHFYGRRGRRGIVVAMAYHGV